MPSRTPLALEPVPFTAGRSVETGATSTLRRRSYCPFIPKRERAGRSVPFILALLSALIATVPYRAEVIMAGAWTLGVYCLARRSPPPEQWGSWAVVGFYTLVAVGGYVGAAMNLPYSSVGFGTDQISISEYAASANDLLGLAGFFALGAAVGWRNLPTAGHRSRRSSGVDRLVGRMTSARVAVVGVVILGVAIMGYGPSSLLTRESYLTHEYRNLLIIGDTLAPVFIFIMWAVTGIRRSRRLLAVAIVLSAAFGTFYLARASRNLGLLVLLSGLGYILGSWSGRRTWRNVGGLVLVAMVSVGALVVPLQLRGTQGHGLDPYLEALGGGGLATTLESGVRDAARLSSNVLSGIAVTSESRLLEVEWSDLVVQLNPLPGGVAGWYDIVDTYRLSPFVPANMPGTLLAFGVPVASVTYLAAGYVMARMDAWSRRERAWSFLVGSAISLLLALFAIVSLQYSVRSSVRYIWYGVTGTSAAVVLARIRRGRVGDVRYRPAARAVGLRHGVS